jgi:DNA repair protein RecO (recombination protein O)
MKTIVTQGIILARTNFQEADRIITMLSSDQGKVRLVAKGVRRPKSKMAGGIELFSVDDITYMPGRGELGTLVSSRLVKHYGNIVKDINRTMYGYDLLKRFNKISEDVVEDAYFDLLQTCLSALDNLNISLDVIDVWITMQLLQLTGHTPNLQTDTNGNKLAANGQYVFSFDDMAFAPTPHGENIVAVAKTLRLAAAGLPLGNFAAVQGVADTAPQAAQLAKTMQQYSLGL